LQCVTECIQCEGLAQNKSTSDLKFLNKHFNAHFHSQIYRTV